MFSGSKLLGLCLDLLAQLAHSWKREPVPQRFLFQFNTTYTQNPCCEADAINVTTSFAGVVITILISTLYVAMVWCIVGVIAALPNWTLLADQ